MDAAPFKNPTTHLERHTNDLQELDNCKVTGVNTDIKAIRVTVLEDDTETREQIGDMAYNWTYSVTEVESQNGSVLLQIEDDSEELSF